MIRMKTALMVMMAGFVAAGARADLISISVENGFSGSNGLSGTLTVEPGMDYLVTGTLTNIGTGAGNTVVLNNVNATPGFADFTIFTTGDPTSVYFGAPDTSVFDPPDTLAPEPDSPVDIDLFDLSVDLTTPTGNYNDWTYSVMDASGDLVGAGFINVVVVAAPPSVPEPGSFGLMGMALGFAAAYQRRRRGSEHGEEDLRR